MALTWMMVVLALGTAALADVETRQPTLTVTPAIHEELAMIREHMVRMEYQMTEVVQTVQELSKEIQDMRRQSDENWNQLEEIKNMVESLPGVSPASDPDKEILFLNRIDGSVDFYRNWTEYQSGFGYLEGEFWLGLEYLHNITITRQYGLHVNFRDWEGNYYQSRYSHISVGGEADGYRLSVFGYDESSTGGDSLSNDNNRAFTTYNRDNDGSSGNCAVLRKGGWWYDGCGYTGPTGLYLTRGQIDITGITWQQAKYNWYSYKTMRFTLIPA